MPTYEYQCSKCGHTFEKSQSISDESLKICLKELCGMKKWGKGKVKRAIVAGAGIIFKGSGFYITDYRSENYKESAKKESGTAAPSGESKSGAVAESKGGAAGAKTEAKSESKPAKSPKPGKAD